MLGGRHSAGKAFCGRSCAARLNGCRQPLQLAIGPALDAQLAAADLELRAWARGVSPEPTLQVRLRIRPASPAATRSCCPPCRRRTGACAALRVGCERLAARACVQPPSPDRGLVSATRTRLRGAQVALLGGEAEREVLARADGFHARLSALERGVWRGQRQTVCARSRECHSRAPACVRPGAAAACRCRCPGRVPQQPRDPASSQPLPLHLRPPPPLSPPPMPRTSPWRRRRPAQSRPAVSQRWRGTSPRQALQSLREVQAPRQARAGHSCCASRRARATESEGFRRTQIRTSVSFRTVYLCSTIRDSSALTTTKPPAELVPCTNAAKARSACAQRSRMADPARRSQQRPPKGEHLAHSASSRFHQDGRPHREGDEDSGDGEMARRRRRQRKRPQEVLSEGEEQERGPAGASPLSAQLSRLCGAPVCVAPPGAARLYDKLEQLEQARSRWLWCAVAGPLTLALRRRCPHRRSCTRRRP